MIITEKETENRISSLLKQMGYSEYNRPFYNENDLQQSIDFELLTKQLFLINKDLNDQYINDAINKIRLLNFSNVDEGNRKSILFLKEGIPIEIRESEKSITKNVKLIDFDNIENNEFKFVRQLKLIDTNKQEMIPDILVLINGLPISIIEVKSIEGQTLIQAQKQAKNYSIRALEIGYWNIFGVVSNGIETKYGGLNQNNNKWFSWKQRDINSPIENDIENDTTNYEKNIQGLFDKNNILNIIKNYCYFQEKENDYIKILPQYYQFFAIEKSIISIKNAKHGKGGVVWHTQGSGKSVSMVFLAKRIKDNFKDKNYKLIYVTDRNDLDNQLYKRFCESYNDYLYLKPKNIENKNELKEVLSNQNEFGIYFTTIQKFDSNTKLLSDSNDVIIIADEAHRSHNNLDEELEVDKENKIVKEKYGFAYFLRKAFPNAIFIGFTGTPLMKNDKNTTDIFGDYIHKYPMNQSIDDGSTVPIHYEKRKIQIVAERANELDELYEKEKSELNVLTNDISASIDDYVHKKLLQMSNLLNDKDVIKTLVTDFWLHYEHRKNVLNGKALFVAFNRKIAFNIYKELINQNPSAKDMIRLVVTSSNKDNKEMIDVIPNSDEIKKIATEFKKENSTIKIVVVVDMWLTGFDVPDLDTLYLFKVIKWHNLMQTIARVNRTYSKKIDDNSNSYKIKEDGLIVDYIGIWKYISEALKQYADNKKTNEEYDIESVKVKMIDLMMEIHRKFFDKTNLIQEWLELDEEKKFITIEKGFELIMDQSKKDKELFFTQVKKLIRYFKLCSQILSKDEKLEANFYILIKNFIRSSNVENSVDVNKMISKLKEKMGDIIKTGDVEISTINLDGKRDLAYISKLLEKEMDAYKKNNKISNLSILNINNHIKSNIKELSKTHPIKSQQLSEKLNKLIEKFDLDKNIDSYLKEVTKFAMIMKESYENNIFDKDPDMQAIYEIFCNDDFAKYKNNSQVLIEVTKKIYDIFQKHVNSEWWTNRKIQSTVNMEIKNMLKQDYNYPPDLGKILSDSLVNELNNFIKRDNKKWLRKDEL